MPMRKVAIYYAWSRPGEVTAPLDIIENRLPTLFESRRMLYPRFEELRDVSRFDQGIAGFLDHIMKQNFVAFLELARAITDHRVVEIERIDGTGRFTPLGREALKDIDTLIVISFDSLRTEQQASQAEIDFVGAFLSVPDNLIFVGPHHDIGEESATSHEDLLTRQVADFLHHGDRTITPQQGFGGFSRSLLAGLGVPVENRFGLRPAAEPDGSPVPIEPTTYADRLDLLAGVRTFNLHPHLPHLERLGVAAEKLDVLARQKIDLTAPPHPFTAAGRRSFDALLQSASDAFAGTLLVGDATLWSSTAGGLDGLRAFWTNILKRPNRGKHS